jgi:hypothetical protein
VLVGLLGLCVRRGVATLSVDDTFFHLRFGHEFLNGWSIGDPGSVTTLATRDWAPTQWAAQMLMAVTEDAFGLAGIAWLAGFLFASYVVALYAACRQIGSPLTSVLVTLVAFAASAQGLSARPQMASYIFVVATTAAWLKTARDHRLRWWLVPLTWVWASLHGMWPIGILIGGVAVLALLLDQRPDRRWLISAAGVPAGSAVAAALTPVGPRIYTEIFTVGSRSKYFAEWGPTDFGLIFPMLLVAMLAVVVLVRLRQAPLSWTETLLLLLASGWAIYSARTVPVAAAMVAPLATSALQSLQSPAAAASRREKQLVGAAFIGALALLAALAHSLGGKPPSSPGWEAEALGELPSGTTVLNEWGRGGYLMWKYPELNLVMHGYGDTFTTGELDRNIELRQLDPGWEEDLAATGAQVALLDPDSRLAYALQHSLGWRVTHESDDVAMLVQPGG